MKNIIVLLVIIITGYSLPAQEKINYRVAEAGISLGASKSFLYNVWTSYAFDKHQKVQLGFWQQMNKQPNLDIIYGETIEVREAAKNLYLHYAYCIKLDYANDIVLAAGPALMIPGYKKYYSTEAGASFYLGFNLWTRRKNMKEVRGGFRLGGGAMQSRRLSCAYADFGILFKLSR